MNNTSGFRVVGEHRLRSGHVQWFVCHQHRIANIGFLQQYSHCHFECHYGSARASLAQLTVSQQPSTTANAGTAFATQPKVTVTDAYGNTTTSNAVITATGTTGATSPTAPPLRNCYGGERSGDVRWPARDQRSHGDFELLGHGHDRRHFRQHHRERRRRQVAHDANAAFGHGNGLDRVRDQPAAPQASLYLAPWRHGDSHRNQWCTPERVTTAETATTTSVWRRSAGCM